MKEYGTIRMRNVEITIIHGRWEVTIDILNKDTGDKRRYIASADSWLTEHDHIWFGTPEELEEDVE